MPVSVAKHEERHRGICGWLPCVCLRHAEKPLGRLQPFTIPTAPWKEISMDWTTWELGKYLFSKQVHFVACPKIPSVQTLTKLFVQHIYCLHGVPERIISDQGVQFTSRFWQEFLKLLGTTQGLRSLHHPQTNSAREQYFRCYVNYQQDDWIEFLPFAEVAYNNSIHDNTMSSLAGILLLCQSSCNSHPNVHLWLSG